MIRPAVQTFAQHHNGHYAAAVRMPAQQSRWQEFSQVSALADMPHDSSGFGRRLFASIFSSGRATSIAARRGDLIVSSRALKRVGSPRLFHDLGSYFADRSHAVGALPLLRNPFLKRQHLHLASNLCGAALAHHVSLSSLFTRWIKKYQQVRTMFWVIPPSCRRAI